MIKIDWRRLFQRIHILGFYIYYDLKPGSITKLKIGWSRSCLRGNYNDAAIVYRLKGTFGYVANGYTSNITDESK